MKEAKDVIHLTQQQLDALAMYDWSIPTSPRLHRIWGHHWGPVTHLEHVSVGHIYAVDETDAWIEWLTPIIVAEPVHKIVDTHYLDEVPAR